MHETGSLDVVVDDLARHSQDFLDQCKLKLKLLNDVELEYVVLLDLVNLNTREALLDQFDGMLIQVGHFTPITDFFDLYYEEVQYCFELNTPTKVKLVPAEVIEWLEKLDVKLQHAELEVVKLIQKASTTLDHETLKSLCRRLGYSKPAAAIKYAKAVIDYESKTNIWNYVSARRTEARF